MASKPQPALARASTLQREPAPAKPRTAPEALTIVLAALAALGAIAGVASVGWLGDAPGSAAPRLRRRPDAILRDLEAACVGTNELFRNIARHSPLFGLVGAASGAPLKFGLAGARMSTSEAQVVRQLASDAASMLVLATHASIEAMAAIEDGDIAPPDAVFDQLGAAQERLNSILVGRIPLKAAVDTALAVAENLTKIVRDVRAHLARGG